MSIREHAVKIDEATPIQIKLGVAVGILSAFAVAVAAWVWIQSRVASLEVQAEAVNAWHVSAVNEREGIRTSLAVLNEQMTQLRADVSRANNKLDRLAVTWGAVETGLTVTRAGH